MKNKVRIKGSVITYSAVIYREGDLYVAWSPEFDIACQGRTMEEASNDLNVSIKLYLTYPHAKIPKTDFDFIAVSPRVIRIDPEELKT